MSSGVCCPEESRSCSVCWSRNGGKNRSRGSCFSLPPRTWRRNYVRDGRKYKRWVAPRSLQRDMQRYIQFFVCGQTEGANVQMLKQAHVLFCSLSWSRRRGARERRTYQSLFAWEEPWDAFKRFHCDHQRKGMFKYAQKMSFYWTINHDSSLINSCIHMRLEKSVRIYFVSTG